jgi:twinkle protein
MSMKEFIEFGIIALGAGPEVHTTCPQCSHTRKKPNVKCLSANIEKGCWVCHHCGWAGSLKGGEDRKARPMEWKPQVYRRPNFVPADPTDDLLAFFAARGIPASIVSEYHVRVDVIYFQQLEDRVPAVVFPYLRNGEVINCKYRGLAAQPDGKKVFRQEWDTEKIVYGLDDMNAESVVIVEGEMDKLACAVAGVRACVSVPDGAPAPNAKSSEKKFEYLANCESYFEPLKKIILAVDNDAPGKNLEAELARRLGQERCWRVQWPEGCKDANDVLLKHGTAALREAIDQAKPWPIDQCILVSDIAQDVIALRTAPIPRGVSTGWATMDECYTVRPGELTIVTGMPGHGKSEWLDALLMNLAMLHDWSFTMCSPENLPVTRHVSKLIEKNQLAPFYPRGGDPGMERTQVYDGLTFLHDHFCFIAPDESLTIVDVLKKAKAFVFQRGIRGLVLDPWNEFDHRRGPGLSETEHIAASLGLLRRFAITNEVHVWVVAHPAKMQRRDDDTYPVVRPYDISGSAHWYNRADNCLSIWRDPSLPVEDPGFGVTTVHVQKVRSKYVGTVGQVQLQYVRECGVYRTIDPC